MKKEEDGEEGEVGKEGGQQSQPQQESNDNYGEDGPPPPYQQQNPQQNYPQQQYPQQQYPQQQYPQQQYPQQQYPQQQYPQQQYPQQQQPQPGQYGRGGVEVKRSNRHTRGCAIAGIVFGILGVPSWSCLCGTAAIVMGAIACCSHDGKRDVNGCNHCLAIGSLATGLLAFALCVLMWVLGAVVWEWTASTVHRAQRINNHQMERNENWSYSHNWKAWSGWSRRHRDNSANTYANVSANANTTFIRRRLKQSKSLNRSSDVLLAKIQHFRVIN